MVACKGPETVCTLRHTGRFSVTGTVTMGAGVDPWCLTVVYGPQPDADKIEFLDELRAVHACVTPAWMVAGDFNLI